MLVPASIVGLVVFIYGLATMSTDDISNEICGENGGLIMCPQCDQLCSYWHLNESCTYSQVGLLPQHSIEPQLSVDISFFFLFEPNKTRF